MCTQYLHETFIKINPYKNNQTRSNNIQQIYI